MRIILILTFCNILRTQSREYFYNKPQIPFQVEDGKQQYLKPYSSMTISGRQGQKYEVSMAPSRNIFEMHLGHHQYYTQDLKKLHKQQSQQQQFVGVNSLQQIANQQTTTNGYHQQYTRNALQQQHQQYDNQHAFLQQATQLQPQQIAYSPIVANTGTASKIQAFNYPNTLTSSYYNTQPQTQSKSRRRPAILKVCYTSGLCEYVSDNQHLQRILQQSRTKLPSTFSMAQPLFQNSIGSIPSSNRVQKDRRLFPYSEFPIEKYPFKK